MEGDGRGQKDGVNSVLAAISLLISGAAPFMYERRNPCIFQRVLGEEWIIGIPKANSSRTRPDSLSTQDKS